MSVDAQNQNKPVQKWVTLALQGDETAFAQLYDVYFEKIYRFVYFRVNHKETAEDLVSEIFIKTWDAITELDDARKFNGWIYQIARNLIIDHYRARKQNVDLLTLENVLRYEDNIVQKTDLDFDLKKCLTALDELSDDQQIVIRMKFIEDLDNSEIAAILDKTETAVRVIQHRALAQMKKFLNKNHDE